MVRTNLVYWDISEVYTLSHTADSRALDCHSLWRVISEAELMWFEQEETLRLKRIAAASEKPHDSPSYSSTTVTAVGSSLKTLTCSRHFTFALGFRLLFLCVNMQCIDPTSLKYYGAGEPNQRRSSHDPHIRGADHPGAGGDARQVLPLSGCGPAAEQGNSCGSRQLICYRLQWFSYIQDSTTWIFSEIHNMSSIPLFALRFYINCKVLYHGKDI